MKITSSAAFRDAFSVSRETEERLSIYANLLSKWNPKINLVAKSTIDDMWSRHFADSAQLFQFRDPAHIHWLDVGSGAGFPGLVIAAMALDTAADLRVTLIESDQRKSAFIRNVIRETGVTATIITDRIEKVPPQNADIISARALADLTQLMAISERHRKKQGLCLFLKGRKAEDELTKAGEDWHMDVSQFPSLTDPDASVIKIGAFHRVSQSS